MSLSRICPMWRKCSVNDCPLTEGFSVDKNDSERACPLSAEKIQELRSRPIENATPRDPTHYTTVQKCKSRKADGSLFVMTYEQAEKVRAMLKWNCFYFGNGFCMALSKNGNACRCPQLDSYTVCCTWCADAVISLNKALDKEIFSPNNKTTLDDVIEGHIARREKGRPAENVKQGSRAAINLTSAQKASVNSLIRKECCNFSGGNCAILDDGCLHDCPQVLSSELTCSWFIEAVLPLDPVLEAKISPRAESKLKKCAECGKEFAPTNNRAKYCQRCAKKIKREQQVENHRKLRSSINFRAKKSASANLTKSQNLAGQGVCTHPQKNKISIFENRGDAQ